MQLPEATTINWVFLKNCIHTMLQHDQLFLRNVLDLNVPAHDQSQRSSFCKNVWVSQRGQYVPPFKKTQQVFSPLFSDIECVLTISWPLIFNVEFGAMHRIAEEQTTFGRSSVLPKGQYIWEAASIFRTKKKHMKEKKEVKF